MFELIMTLALIYQLSPESQYSLQPTLTNGDKVVEAQVGTNEPIFTYICSGDECQLVDARNL